MPKTNIGTITRPCYTMAKRNGNSAEINMYGEIVESRPVDWWTGEPVAGEFIVLTEFLEDLNTIAGVTDLTIHMNSLGGDGVSSIAIHNRLRELDANLTVVVDGAAQSGGSLIMCAAKPVRVSPSSIIMIHRCWSYLRGACNANDLDKHYRSLCALDQSQAEIYARKTGKTIEEILTLMDNEECMTGRRAVELGFADELIDDAEDLDISMSADKQHLYVNGHTMRVSTKGSLPVGIKTVDTAPKANCQDKSITKTEGGSPMPMTFEDFQKENPELANQALEQARASAGTDAIAAERKRLSDIDAVASLYDDETVNAAKYGEKPCTAQEMTYRAAMQNALQGKQFASDTERDYKASGAAGVQGSSSDEEERGSKPLTAAERIALGRADAQRVNGEKKEEK